MVPANFWVFALAVVGIVLIVLLLVGVIH